jgi:hypothetical protein
MKSSKLNHIEQEWMDKAKNRYEFNSNVIPDVLSAAISGALEETETEDDVAQVFQDIWLGYP